MTSWGPDDLQKLKQTINAGADIKQEVKDLNESLNDLVKETSKELNIPPKIIRNAITRHFKGDLQDVNTDNQLLNDVLDAVK